MLTELPHSSVSKCLIEIFQNHLTFTQKFSIHFNNKTAFIASEILQNLNTTSLANTVEYRPESGVIDKRMLTDLVIILDETADIFYILNTTLWFGDTRFLIYSNSTNSLNSIFKYFWTYKVVNVFAFIQNNDDLVFYSFLPFEGFNCTIGDPKIVDMCINGKFKTGNISEINDKERVKNMQGCPVNVTMVDAKPHVIFKDECNCNGTKHVEGVEGKAMVVVAERLNCNASYYLPPDGPSNWGFLQPKPAGAIGQVYTGHSEFAIGMLGPLLERFENFDFSIEFTPMECISFGVPRGMRAKQKVWITFLIGEFTEVLWLSIGGSFLLVITAFMVFSKLSVTDQKFYKDWDLILFVIATAIGVQVKSPKLRLLRVLFITLVWLSFIIMVAYQSSLSSKLIVPALDKDIETFEQLLESNLEIKGLKNIYHTMEYNKNETIIGRLLSRYHVTNQSIESAIEVMTYKRNIAYVRHRTSFIYYSLINQESKGAVNTLKDCVYLYYPIMMMKKYSPYTNRLNKIIRGLIEGGIINYWRSFYIYYVPPNPNPLMKLSMKKMKGIFMFLEAGMFAFIGEVMHYHFSRKVRS